MGKIRIRDVYPGSATLFLAIYVRYAPISFLLPLSALASSPHTVVVVFPAFLVAQLVLGTAAVLVAVLLVAAVVSGNRSVYTRP